MLESRPNLLVHDYLQRMMVWLLFVEPARPAIGSGGWFSHQALPQGAAYENHWVNSVCLTKLEDSAQTI